MAAKSDGNESSLEVRHAAYLEAHSGVDPNGDPERPLSIKQFAFGIYWRGNHTDAARDAGYAGSRSTLSSLGARLFQDPRVQRLIESRRAAGELDGGDPVDSGTAPVGQIPKGPKLSGSVREQYAAIANNEMIAMGHRMRALERIEQMDRREQGANDVEAERAKLLAMVNEKIKAKRARERGESGT